MRKIKKCCKHPKTSFTRANIRYVEHPKNEKVLQTSENQLYQGKHPICQKSEKPKSCANNREAAFPGQTSDMSNIRKTKKCCIHAKTSFTRANIRYVEHPKIQKVLQTSENQLYQGEHPIFQTSEKPKSAANMRKSALPGRTSDMSNIRKTKKVCKHEKTSFTRANIRYFKHQKNQKVLQKSENQLYQGEHPICQTSEKRKSDANIRKPALPGQTSDMSTSKKPKGAANIRKPALPWQTSDMSNIRKNKRCWKHPKSKFSRANIRYVKHAKIQKVLQTSENQLYQGEHPICQTSEKPKSAANMRKPALPGQTSDLSNIRKTKKCCKHAKTSFTRANIRCRTSEKRKSAANIRKPALPGQTSDMSKIRKTEKYCKQPRSSFSRANIRYVKHPKNQKVLQTSENQLYQGEHPICQTSEKPKSAANMRKPALPGQTSDLSNIRKTKKCCKHEKTSFTRANIRSVKHPKNQKVLQTCENQLY